MPAEKTIKVVKDPRISVNKLAEYLEANSTRRKRIVLDAKYQKPYITTRYKDARVLAVSFLCKSINEDEVLAEIENFDTLAAEAVEKKDDFVAQNSQLSSEALGLLLESEYPEIAEYELLPYAEENKYLFISGVSVSVNPDMIVKNEVADGFHLGAIKLNITKTTQLSDESQKTVAVILHEYARKHVVDSQAGELVNYKLCFSIDLFKQHCVCCPSAMKRILKRVEDACEEIALWWERL
jgi:hypothetical protein